MNCAINIYIKVKKVKKVILHITLYLLMELRAAFKL